MKTWKKVLFCIVLSFGFLLISVGYAAVSDILNIAGNVVIEGQFYDVYISSISPEVSESVSVNTYFGTTMHSTVARRGTAEFSITVVNESDKTYVYERVIDGAEANLEGVYNGTDIVYTVTGIAPFQDTLAPGDSITFTLTISNTKGITTDNFYLKFNFIEKTGTEILPGGDPDPTVPPILLRCLPIPLRTLQCPPRDLRILLLRHPRSLPNLYTTISSWAWWKHCCLKRVTA